MRSRRLTFKQRLLLGLVLAAGPVVVVAVLLLRGEPERSAPLPPAVHAGAVRSSTIYHSPQRPGYTAWVGAWIMPDDTLMTGFVQATGPVDPDSRARTPASVLEQFGNQRDRDPQRDFWGLDMTTRFLSSRDGGRRWTPSRAERFRAPAPFGYTSQATIALRDGTIVRRVNGDDLRQEPDTPHTAFLQRLAPGAKRWSNPQVLLDPRRTTYQLSRIKYLRDGRLVATGNRWDVPASTSQGDRAKVPSTFLLLVSSDKGRTWRNGLEIPSSVGDLPGLEWDTGELPSGDLAAVMRTLENGKQVRKQALLKRDGDKWVMTSVKRAPMPHSGHPELLATREGPVLDIATTGVRYTRDGQRWVPLRFRGQGRKYRSAYYPRAVQTGNGVVYVFGHRGFDNPYAAVDQAITMDTFRLAPGA